MSRNYNDARGATTISGTLTAGATTVTVASTANFPTPPFEAMIGANAETVLAESLAGAVYTIIRGWNGTTDQEHADGTAFAFRASSESYRGVGPFPRVLDNANWISGDGGYVALGDPGFTVALAGRSTSPGILRLSRLTEPENIRIETLAIRTSTAPTADFRIVLYALDENNMPAAVAHDLATIALGGGPALLTATPNADVLAGHYWLGTLVTGASAVTMFGLDSAVSPPNYFGENTIKNHITKAEASIPDPFVGPPVTPADNITPWIGCKYGRYGG